MQLVFIIICVWFVPFIEPSLQACNGNWTFCSPLTNETWYHHGQYEFEWNRNNSYVNNMTEFNINLFTLTNGNEHTRNRMIKSWVHLSNKTDSLQVKVTDDWFPTLLPTNASNITWTMIAFLSYDSNRSFVDDANTFNVKYSNLVQFHVVQSPAKVVLQKSPISLSEDIAQFHTWIIAVIVVACVVVIVAICAIIWFYRKMQKKAAAGAPILSKPDALMIADTFRQVMSTSEVELDKKRSQVGEDLLKRQLASEGTSVSEIERRTSSKKSNN